MPWCPSSTVHTGCYQRKSIIHMRNIHPDFFAKSLIICESSLALDFEVGMSLHFRYITVQLESCFALRVYVYVFKCLLVTCQVVRNLKNRANKLKTSFFTLGRGTSASDLSDLPQPQAPSPDQVWEAALEAHLGPEK